MLQNPRVSAPVRARHPAWQAILLGGAKLKRGDVSGVDAPVCVSLPFQAAFVQCRVRANHSLWQASIGQLSS